MNASESKIVNLINDKLFTMVSSGKLSYEILSEIQLYVYWAFEMHKKKLADGPGENGLREQDNFYVDRILSGDELSVVLKKFLHLTTANPGRLHIERSNFVKGRVWKIPCKKSEKEIVRRVMRGQEKIESILLDTINIIDTYEQTLTEDELEKFLNEHGEDDES